MASNSIVVDTSKRFGWAAQGLADKGATLRANLSQLRKDAEAMVDGTDYSKVETAFGLEAGKGSAFVYLLANADTAFGSAAALNQLIDWVGGLVG